VFEVAKWLGVPTLTYQDKPPGVEVRLRIELYQLSYTSGAAALCDGQKAYFFVEEMLQ